MKIDLDRHQILYYLEGCARGSHLRQGCWHDMINLYPKMTQDVRDYIYTYAKQDYDSGYKVWAIGTKEEFLQRRLAIQAAVRRCQVANRYTAGGKGRKKKCKAIDRWHEVEKNYVDTKLHTYSRKLVGMAVKHRCAVIRLCAQEEREEDAKSDVGGILLRNWSYFGLRGKIEYKAKMYGIKIEVE